MTSIDNFLKEYTVTRTLKPINHRDDEILASLSKQMAANIYVTERQADLAIKIIGENIKHLLQLSEIIKNPKWDNSFRIIQRFKYLHLVKNTNPDRFFIEIGFNHTKTFTKKLDELKNKLSTPLTRIKNNVWQIPYSELDLYHLVELVKSQNFEISPEILEAHREIFEILKQENKDKIYIDIDTSENLKNRVSVEVGEIINTNILLEDRKIGYQYEIFDSFFQKKSEKNLIEKIATRTGPQIFISSKTHELNDVVSSLQELNRFPMLVIFDSLPEKSEKNLKILRNSLIENNVNEGVGIYFRHNNDQNGKPFNEQISQFQYNQPLNNNTVIAGITNLKIPKFLLKLKWQPKSVLVLAQVLGSNRVKLLTDYCDLVIHYQDKKPLKEAIEEIV
jgi:hypothetical protein